MSTERTAIPVEAKQVSVAPTNSERSVNAAAGYDRGQRDALGGYLRRIAAKPLLSRTEERRLARRARAGSKKARDELVSRNLRLVLPTAKKFRGQGVPFEDLIQEGNAGLMVAASKFNPEMGNRFSTYASRWIHQRIAHAVENQGRTIRLPRELEESRHRTYRAAREYAATEGREPSVSELCELAGVSQAVFERAWSAPEARASLDAPVRADEPDSAELGSLIADSGQSEEVAGEALALLSRLEVWRSLSVLGPRQRYVLERLYGLYGDRTVNQRELATEMGVSTTRVSMIDREARAKLAESLRAHGINDSYLREAG